MDDRVPEHRDSQASSSHEPSLEPTSTRSEELGKHSVYIHFLKDRNCERNCEIRQRTKITWAPCRRRNGGDVPRASSIRCGGARVGNPTVQNKNLSGNRKELAKVLGAREET